MKCGTIVGRALLITGAVGISAGLIACGGGTVTAARSSPASPQTTSAGTAAKTYPDQAADATLCKTYNTDISSSDTYDIQMALQQAIGSVSPELALDIQAAANGTTLQQDMRAQLKVAGDCALVTVGVSPGS